MSRSKKLLLLIGGLVILVLVGLVLLVKLVITPEKVREALIPLAEKNLQRSVTLGDIEIGLFSGVSLKDLHVKQRQGSDDFVAIQALDLNYQLLPLLTGKVVIDQVRLVAPQILVVRNPDGSFNFSDLLDSTEPSTAESPSTGAEPSTGGGPLDLLVNEVSISGGELQFVDRSEHSESPYRYSLSQLSLQAQDITLERSFPLDFSANLNGSKLAVKGDYDLRQQAGNLSISLNPLDLIQFAPYYRSAIPGKLGSGQLSLQLEVDLASQQIQSKGQITLAQLDLSLDQMPEAVLENARLQVDYSLAFQPDPKILDLRTLLINFNGIQLGSEGQVTLAGAEPQLNLALILDNFDLRSLVQGMPKGLSADLQGLGLAGTIDGRIDLEGKPSAGAGMVKKASVQLKDVQASVNDLRAGVSGDIAYQNAEASAEALVLDIGGQQARLAFQVGNLLSKPVRGTFQVTADTLDINQMIPKGKSAEVSPTSVKMQKAPAEEIGPFDIPVDMQGTLEVKTLAYRKLQMENVHGELLLRDNHLKIVTLKGQVAGGELNASTDVNLGVKGLSYQGQLNVSQSRLAGLLAGLFPQAKQSMTGLLQWQNSFSGKGTLPDNLLNALQLQGLVEIQQGELSGSPLLEKFAGFLGSPDLNTLNIQSLQSKYDLRNGLAKLSGGVDSPKLKLTPNGTVGVNGLLDMSLDARLAPELMAKLGGGGMLKQALTDADGWGMLPIKLGGSLTSPQFSFDTKALQKQAAGKAKQEVQNKILEKIAPAGKNAAPEKKLLNNTLKKLFGN